jgi:signal transduction histidine kinase
MRMAIAATLFLIIFIFFLRKKLLPLTSLAKKLQHYDPSKQEDLKIQCNFSENKKDEITVIAKTVLSMIQKINQYTNELNDINKNLEQRVKEEVEKNREKNKMLIQQSRHAALGEMLGNIAHQWRQPLNTLGLMLQDLEDAYDDDTLNKEYLNAKYPSDILQNILLSKVIYDGKSRVQTPEGFEQIIQTQNVDIEYRVTKNETFFKDRKNRIMFKIKDIK